MLYTSTKARGAVRLSSAPTRFDSTSLHLRGPASTHRRERTHRRVPAPRASTSSVDLPLSAPWGQPTPGSPPSGAPISLVVKFGGSSVATAERMREVADIVCGFDPPTVPIVVLSAMGKTTNLLLQAGAEALHASPKSVGSLHSLREIKELHRETAERLNVDDATVDDMESLLLQLTQLLVGISIMQDLTPRAKDSLVSFGERLSTRLFSAYLRASGVPSSLYDAPEIGVITNDNFTNADVDYDETLDRVRATFKPLMDGSKPPEIPVVTGFLGRGKATGAITTLGRGGSDLTCTLLGAVGRCRVVVVVIARAPASSLSLANLLAPIPHQALGLEEVQVWKDVDGVLTSDPRIVDAARPVTRLTFEEVRSKFKVPASRRAPRAPLTPHPSPPAQPPAKPTRQLSWPFSAPPSSTRSPCSPPPSTPTARWGFASKTPTTARRPAPSSPRPET